MKRNCPLRTYTRLRRYTPLRARSRNNKRQPAESAYLRWIRSLPCAICGGACGLPSEAAHTLAFGASGMAQKSPHRSCVPLCSWCHTMGPNAYHRMPEWKWAECHSIDVEALVVQLNECFSVLRAQRRKAAV